MDKRKRAKVSRLKEKEPEPYVRKIWEHLYEVGPNPKLICGPSFLRMLWDALGKFQGEDDEMAQ